MRSEAARDCGKQRHGVIEGRKISPGSSWPGQALGAYHAKRFSGVRSTKGQQHGNFAPMKMPRAQGLLIATSLSSAVVGLLAFAHAFANLEGKPRCFPDFIHAQWPKWIGCAMAAHEDLSGGLIASAGALFAAWLAFSSVQRQLRDEANKRLQGIVDGKQTSILAITHPVHAASATLGAIRQAISAQTPEQINNTDSLVTLGVSHTQATLDHFSVREVLKDLDAADRLRYLSIVSYLTAFLNISLRPSPILSRDQRLTAQTDILMKLRPILRGFDGDLAEAFDKDAGLTTGTTS